MEGDVSGDGVAAEPPVSASFSTSEGSNEEEIIRQKLRFFFFNPMEKWVARRQFPWKFFIQVVKIITVTSQLIVFGEIRMGHIQYLEASSTVFRHLFMNKWEALRDLNIYPPSSGPYAVYSVDDFYDRLSFAVHSYYNVTNAAIGSFDYNKQSDSSEIPPPRFCVKEFQSAMVFPNNNSYSYDVHIVERCIGLDNSTSCVAELLSKRNFSINFDRLVSAELEIFLKTISLRTFISFDIPDCFLFQVKMMFDNNNHNGQIVVKLSADIGYIAECTGSVAFASNYVLRRNGLIVLDVVVMVVCIVSGFLCLRALINAQFLYHKTNSFFVRRFNKRISSTDRLLFFNAWYMMIVLNDVMTILGTIFKLSIEYKIFDSALFTVTGILLGLGTLLVWLGLLRYLGFFSQYNVLILTMKKAFPNVMRFMLCAGLLYFAFLFCGWVVIGPYNFKFRTLMSTSECLFALINGDDMFATFFVTSTGNMGVVWFSRIYLYTFISLFTYIVLSLFISIIMDAYEIIKEKYDHNKEKSDLLEFVDSCVYSSSGQRNKRASQPSCLQLKRIFQRCQQCCCPSAVDTYDQID